MKPIQKIPSMLLFLLLISLIFANQASAASLSLALSPALTTISMANPTTTSAPLTITNQSKDPVTLSISFKSFLPKDELGTVRYIDTSSNDITKYVQIQEDGNSINQVTLSPYQHKQLQLLITTPTNQTNTDYYFSVIFTSKNTSDTNTSSSQVVEQIASHVLVKVGRNSDGLQIKEFTTQRFFTQGPVPFIVRLENPGRHFLTTSGEIDITNMFGQHVGKVNLPNTNILARTTRKLHDGSTTAISWQEGFLLGPYSVDIFISSTDSNIKTKQTIHFFAFPISAILTTAVILITSIFLIKRVKQKTK